MKYHRKAILGHFSRGEKFRSKQKSGWFDKTILAAGLLLLTFAAVSLITKNNTLAKEINTNITIDRVGIFAGTDVITVKDEDHASTNPADYANKMSEGTLYSLNINLDIVFPEGQANTGNDYTIIPINIEGSENLPDVILNETREIPIYWQEEEIGKFTISSDAIRIDYSPWVAGLDRIDDVVLYVPNVISVVGANQNRVGTVAFDGNQFYFGVSGKNLSNLSDGTYVKSLADDSAVWETRVGSELTNSLSLTGGVIGVPTDTYVEQNFPNAVGHGKVSVYETHMIPLNLSGHANASSRVADSIDRSDKFTEVVQQTGESYASFMHRVMSAAGQYGFYQDSAGLRFIINYGALGADTKFAAAEAWAEQAADSAIEQGYYAAGNKNALIEYYTTSFGRDNNIPQSPANTFSFRVDYERDDDDTQAINVSQTTNVYTNNVLTTYNGSGVLLSAYGLADNLFAPNTATITVFDYSDDGVTTLNGGLYKLQYKDGDEYEDYEYEEGKTTVRVEKNGTLFFENLEPGEYRLVELEVPEGYDITLTEMTDKGEFAIVAGNYGARILVGNKKAVVPEDEDTPVVPKSGAETADKLGSVSDAGICVMTAFGIAMIVIAIKRKISIE